MYGGQRRQLLQYKLITNQDNHPPHHLFRLTILLFRQGVDRFAEMREQQLVTDSQGR
jgi:hypothetical protein